MNDDEQAVANMLADQKAERMMITSIGRDNWLKLFESCDDEAYARAYKPFKDAALKAA